MNSSKNPRKSALSACHWLALYLLPLTLCLPLQAQDTRAKTCLDKAAQAYTQAGALRAQFDLEVIMPDDRSRVKGTIELWGQKFHFDAPELETWYDGHTQWTFQKENNEVSISEPSETQATNPASIFALYKQGGCTYHYLGDYKIKLTLPRTSDVASIILQINPKDYLPTFIHLLYRNRAENILYISNYQKNINLSDKDFTFDKSQHPDAYINDLR